MSGSSSSSKNHNKKSNSRDRNKSVASESGGSSQCDTPPLIEKDASTSQGRFAGVGPESILCMAEQVAAELNVEAAANLAEDVSYKLRQTISTIALHSEMLKKSRVDCWDVNSVLTLADTSPVVGTCASQYASVGEERLCCQVETLLNVTECALTPQTYVYSTLPTVSVEWITDEKSLNNNSNISVSLQHYYTKVARAILNLRKKTKEIAVEDLMTNTRIGPIFPNLFNLAVLVLNEDNLNALNVTAKKPLQSNLLDMVDALCSNPCSSDTNIQQQFQRLFPVMVSNILGDGTLADKMVAVLTKITRTWPPFVAIGRSILFDYLAQGTKERLTAPMIKCLIALGRHALVACLDAHLAHLDDAIHAPRSFRPQPDLLRETLLVLSVCIDSHLDDAIHAPRSFRPEPDLLRKPILDVSTCLLRSEPTTYLEDYVTTDYALYEILGDSIMPRRTLFPYTNPVASEDASADKSSEEEFAHVAARAGLPRPRVRLAACRPRARPPAADAFEPARCDPARAIRIKINNCRFIDLPKRRPEGQVNCSPARNVAVVASGLLNRFRFRLKKTNDAFPLLGALTI